MWRRGERHLPVKRRKDADEGRDALPAGEAKPERIKVADERPEGARADRAALVREERAHDEDRDRALQRIEEEGGGGESPCPVSERWCADVAGPDLAQVAGPGRPRQEDAERMIRADIR
jgi:hypothetical protein